MLKRITITPEGVTIETDSEITSVPLTPPASKPAAAEPPAIDYEKLRLAVRKRMQEVYATSRDAVKTALTAVGHTKLADVPDARLVELQAALGGAA